MPKLELDELDVCKSKREYPVIISAEYTPVQHMPGPDTVISIPLNQSLDEILITVMNCFYLMKDGQSTVYIDILGGCIKTELDKHGTGSPDDLYQVFEAFKELFHSVGNDAINKGLEDLQRRIYTNSFRYEGSD